MENIMFTNPVKLMATLAALIVTTAGVSADPGKGLRWSDFAFGPTRGQTMRTPVYRGTFTPIVVGTPVVSSGPGVVGTPSAPATITIRGSDGVVRTFPLANGGVQQQVPTQAYVIVRDPDGVYRTYPVTSTSTPSPEK